MERAEFGALKDSEMYAVITDNKYNSCLKAPSSFEYKYHKNNNATVIVILRRFNRIQLHLKSSPCFAKAELLYSDTSLQ